MPPLLLALALLADPAPFLGDTLTALAEEVEGARDSVEHMLVTQCTLRETFLSGGELPTCAALFSCEEGSRVLLVWVYAGEWKRLPVILRGGKSL